jgi:hypothetical protein
METLWLLIGKYYVLEKMEHRWTKKNMNKFRKKMMKWAKRKDIHKQIMEAKTDFDYGELIAKCALMLDFDLDNPKETTFIYCGLKKIQQNRANH